MALGAARRLPKSLGILTRYVWLEVWVNRLGAMRGPGESFSDAIIRIAVEEALATRRG
jgi:hypothetical protein